MKAVGKTQQLIDSTIQTGTRPQPPALHVPLIRPYIILAL